MKISRRLVNASIECSAGIVLLLDLFWWHTLLAFLIASSYFIVSYLFYRREAFLNYRYSASIRKGLTLSDIRDIETEYTMREDFDSFEKCAMVRPPLDRFFYYERYRRIQALLSKYARASKRVLDLGCGFGENTIYIGRSLKSDVVGLDLDNLKLKEALSAARKKQSIEKISFICGDASHPPFQPARFDSILLTEVLEHLINPLEALATCRHLLCNGGILLISTPSSHNLDYRNNPLLILEKALSLISDRVLPPYHSLHGRFEFTWRKPEPLYGMHYHFSRQEMETLLRETGFRIIWSGSFEIEIFPYLLIEHFFQQDLQRIRKRVAPVERVMRKVPVLKHLGQHLLCVAQKLE
jgi:SAM-dependent methyltransferase